MIITLFVPFIFWTLLNLGLVQLTKRKFGECMPVTMIGSALIVYFSQMIFSTFRLGIWALFILAILSGIFLVLRYKRIVFQELFSTGLLMFLIICVLYYIIDFNHHYPIFDDYYHWGTMVKESLRLDRFYSVSESHLWIHKDYPPFACMLELIWCKICGGYSEMRTMMGLHVFNFTLILCPLSEKLVSWKRFSKIKLIVAETLLFFMAQSVLLVFDQWPQRTATSLLVDITVPIIFTAVILHLILRQNIGYSAFDVIFCAAGCTAILMIKQVGIAFILLIALFYLLTLIQQRIAGRKTRAGKNIIDLVVIFGAPLLINHSWSAYVDKLHIKPQFDTSSIKLSEYIDSFSQRGIRHDTLANYIRALFIEDIGTMNWFKITYVSAYGIAIIAILVLGHYFKKCLQLSTIFNLIIVFTCGTLGYALLMSVLYLFGFNEVEMLQLASYGRYMSSYVEGESLILFSLTTMCIADNSRRIPSLRKILVVTLTLMVALNPVNILYMSPQAIRGNEHAKYEADANYLNSKIDSGSTVFVVYDNSRCNPEWWGAYQVYLQYYLNDCYFSHEGVDAYAGDYSNENYLKAVLQEIANSDYVYVRDASDNINGELSSTLSCTFTDNTVYKVNTDKQTGSICLVPEL